MITADQYFGPHDDCDDLTPQRRQNAENLLVAVNAMMEIAEADGVVFRKNPKTGSQISGRTLGGFRPQECSQGAPNSSHKEGQAVDLFDPAGEIDAWCMSHQATMASFDIYIEHPSATVGWSHWTTRAPRSGNRVFYP